MTCTTCGADYVREANSVPIEGKFEVKLTHVCPVLVALANEARDLRAAIVSAAMRKARKGR